MNSVIPEASKELLEIIFQFKWHPTQLNLEFQARAILPLEATLDLRQLVFQRSPRFGHRANIDIPESTYEAPEQTSKSDEGSIFPILNRELEHVIGTRASRFP